MRHTCRLGQVIALASLAFVLTAHAGTTYLSAPLQATLRSGPGTEYRIVKILTSGIPLAVLTADKGNGYTRVRDPDGAKSWALSRLLSNRPATAEQLESLGSKLVALELDNQRMSRDNAQIELLRASMIRLQAENERLHKQLKQLQATAASVLSASKPHTDLRQAIDAMVADKERLERENLRLKDDHSQAWLVRGAFVLLVGLGVGMLIPRRHRRWGEL